MEKFKRENFKEKVAISNNKEIQNILKLKEKYENNEIFENELTEEEIKALIELYKNEEKELDYDITRRKIYIKRMLKQMKIHNNGIVQ